MPAEILQMTEAEYRKLDAINFSSLKWMAESPMKYKYMIDHPSETTSAMSLGTIIHTAHLEPEIYAPVVQVCEFNRGTKKFDAEQEKYRHLIMVTDKEAAMIETQREIFRSNEYYDMFNAPDAKTEVAIRWTDSETKLVCKARIDRFTSSILVDVKSSRLSDEHAWINYFYKSFYHVQLAMYHDALMALDEVDRPCICIKMETVPCYDVVPYPVPTEAINGGREIYRGWLWELQNCLESGNWPGKAKNGLREMPVRDWAV